mgnify:CR=1 FL=1
MPGGHKEERPAPRAGRAMSKQELAQALTLLWVRRQRVQMETLRTRPAISIVAVWILGNQRRLVRRLEWLTLCPNCGPLPQISHLAMRTTPFRSGRRWGPPCLA